MGRRDKEEKMVGEERRGKGGKERKKKKMGVKRKSLGK